MVRAMDELGYLLMELSGDERKKEVFVTRLTEMDLAELGISNAVLPPATLAALREAL